MPEGESRGIRGYQGIGGYVDLKLSGCVYYEELRSYEDGKIVAQ